MAEYIERTGLIADMDQAILDIPSSETVDSLTIYAVLRDCACEAPAADVEPVRHGRWDGEGDGYAETEDGEMVIVYDVWNCSKCGYTIDDGTDDPALLPNYCPNCGAKMDGEA